ncbi:hypothetical protein RJT34_32463 [Clitoria ternatea]|uniref:Uncharacterized protein n=1 Tax=Clitoria ternatea TaxID=43366 RepID=A0AAN9I5Y3_CLITE
MLPSSYGLEYKTKMNKKRKTKAVANVFPTSFVHTDITVLRRKLYVIKLSEVFSLCVLKANSAAETALGKNSMAC